MAKSRICSYNKSVLYGKNGFPGIIGCIDGTHIKISAPKVDKDSYVNRKGFYSIILQGVCDHRLKFTDVSCGKYKRGRSLQKFTLSTKINVLTQDRIQKPL